MATFYIWFNFSVILRVVHCANLLLQLTLSEAALCVGRPAGSVRVSREIPMQKRRRREIKNEGQGVECCPTLEKYTNPERATNILGNEVEIYRDEKIKQAFAEYLCKSDVIDVACKSIDLHLNNRAKCVQQYSYVYSIVRVDEAKLLQNTVRWINKYQ